MLCVCADVGGERILRGVNHGYVEAAMVLKTARGSNQIRLMSLHRKSVVSSCALGGQRKNRRAESVESNRPRELAE